MTLPYLKQQAIKEAHPFGGSCLPSYRFVIDQLATEGFVEITCYSPLDNSVGYILTPKGRKEALTYKGVIQ